MRGFRASGFRVIRGFRVQGLGVEGCRVSEFRVLGLRGFGVDEVEPHNFMTWEAHHPNSVIHRLSRVNVRSLFGTHWGNIRVLLGQYGDTGKEH